MNKYKFYCLFLNHVCIFLTTVFLLPSSALAEIKLSWQDCLIQFKKNNPTAKAAELILKSSELQNKAASLGYLPQLNLNVNSVLGASTQSNSQAKDISASLILNQNLFAGFATEATITQTQANVLVSKAILQDTNSSLLYDLKIAYADLLFAQKTNKLLTDIIQRRQQNNDMVKLRFSNGKENKGSLLLAEAYLKLAQFEKFQNQNEIKLQQQKIKFLLDLEDDNIELTDNINSPLITEQENYQDMITIHPEHQQAIAQKQIAEASLVSERSSFYPALNLQYSHNAAGADFTIDQTSWTTGLNLSWSLFNGGKDYYTTQSQIEVKTARELQLIATDRNILNKLLIAKNQLLEAKQKYNVDEAFLNAATVREQISRSKYNNGLANFEDWDQIETDLITREKNLIKSERDKIVSEAAWFKAQGKGAIE
jgi:outer membrane protein TolC